MKRCPTCSRVYDNDSMRFCLDDGTPLVDKLPEMPPPPTLTLPPTQENQPTMKAFQPQPSPHVYVANAAIAPIKRKRNLLIWAIVFALLMPFVAGAIVGGWVILHKRALTWHLILEVDPNAPDRTAAVRQTVDVIERRLNALGLANYEVRPQGDSNSRRIIVNLPKVQDPERLKQIIITLGKLELVHVVSPMSPSPVQTFATKEEAGASLKASGTVPENCRVLPYLERGESAGKDQNATKWVVVESPAIVDGSELRDASAVRGAYDEDYEIQFSLNKTGADKFGTWTGANINEYLGVVLNEEVKSIAYIKSQISDQGIINGRFTKQSAEDLALVLKAGALPTPVRLIEEGPNK